MPGNTSLFGWPKPLPGDPVAQGAETMGKALDEIDKSFALPSGAFNASEPYTSYPIGTSILNVTGSNSGWPYGTGMVVTFRLVPAGTWITQLFSPRTGIAGNQGLYIRYANGSQWSEWVCVSGPGVPKVSASGKFSTTSATAPGNPLGATVPFPAGRFTTAPIVMVTWAGGPTSSTLTNLRTAAIGTGSFNIVANANASGQTHNFQWYAVEEH